MPRPPMPIPAPTVPAGPPPPNPAPPPGVVVMQAPPTVTIPTKSTTVYIGQISPEVDDEFFQQLLNACSTLSSWKRLKDSETGKFKAFGFAEFPEPLDVLRVLRIFDGFEICGQKLALKCNTATRKFLDHFENVVTANVIDEDKKRDQDVRDMVTQMMTDGEVGKKKEVVDKSEMSRSGGGDGRGTDGGSRRGDADSSSRAARDALLDYLERVERNLERERARDERNEEYRRAEDERLYQRRLAEWERHEKDKIHERERYRERLKETEKERGKLIKMDNETFQDEDVPAWKRKPYRMTTRAHNRAHRRQAELEDDDEDRRREAEEDRKRSKKRKVEDDSVMDQVDDSKRAKWQELPAEEPQNASAHVQSVSKPQDVQFKKMDTKQASEKFTGKEQVEDVKSKSSVKKENQGSLQVDSNDPIFAAMVAAASKPAELEEPPGLANGEQEKEQQASPMEIDESKGRQSSKTDTDKRKSSILAAFKTDDEEKKPRKLVPIQYSPEEQQAQTSKPEGRVKDNDDRSSNQDGKVTDQQLALRLLADKIPKTRENIWKYKIRWDRYDQNTAGANIRRWLSKKVVELLGEEESSLVDFIISKPNLEIVLLSRCSCV
eukprot:TRINITY_DN7537_c0_g1_i2.p1 TRINITY_DN7537_c0_g1~~TRINITY_DN7537_c0_g1_i2.p1  ORF type:complete len:648 (+),score=105.54 TRINITY_DN7537_c0_g1_i2:121-1944(+)